MKTCPICDTDYPDQHSTCPTDGAVLIVSHELAAGSLVRGKYRIVRKLGQGGMGVVYLADDILLSVRVALKFLAGDLGKDPRFIKRFRIEARAAYQLRHPNIVEVTNLDQAEDGSLFIAMEFVEGPSLRSELEQARSGFAIPRALAIARGIAAGLAAAHAQGTVHRDVKPENVLLPRTADGRERPKVLDFGIVAVAETVTRLSLTRGLMLTPDYAAPEQWLEMPSAEIDGRTDLYALGCVLYEMLTGRAPFHAHNTSGWMKQHLEQTPRPPSELRAEVADWPGLDALVLGLLTKDRANRPGDAGQVISRLDAARYLPALEGQETIADDIPERPETIQATPAPRPAPSWEPRTPRPMWPPEAEKPADRQDPPLKAETGARPRKGTPRGLRVGLVAGGILLVLAVVAYLAVENSRVRGSMRQSSQPPPPASGMQPAAQPPTPAAPEPVAEKQTANENPGPGPGPKPAPAESPKPSIQEPAKGQGTKPATEAKAPAPMPDPAAMERQADALFAQKRYAEAVPLYDQSCRRGSSHGCYRLGILYYNGQGVRQDYSRAATLYSLACNGAEVAGEGCNNLGTMYAEGKGVAQDYSRAMTLFLKACDHGAAESCSNLGNLYRLGRGVAKDSAKARQFLTEGCNRGNQWGCEILKEMQ